MWFNLKDQGSVWYPCLNNNFHISNILAYIFNYTYFKKLQKSHLKLLCQTPQKSNNCTLGPSPFVPLIICVLTFQVCVFNSVLLSVLNYISDQKLCNSMSNGDHLMFFFFFTKIKIYWFHSTVAACIESKYKMLRACLVYMFKNRKLFKNICENTYRWKSTLKYMKCYLKTENGCLKTQTKHPLKVLKTYVSALRKVWHITSSTNHSVPYFSCTLFYIVICCCG